MNEASTPLSPELLARLQDWTGRSETLQDDITAAPVRALAATLDREGEPARPGTRELRSARKEP